MGRMVAAMTLPLCDVELFFWLGYRRCLDKCCGERPQVSYDHAAPEWMVWCATCGTTLQVNTARIDAVIEWNLMKRRTGEAG